MKSRSFIKIWTAFIAVMLGVVVSVSCREKTPVEECIQPGAASVEEYLPLLEGKRVCILSNQTGMVTETTHLLDTLLSRGVNVVSIMSPEHGFRGTADAGEHVSSSVDEATGVPIRSLYDGKGGRPSAEAMEEFDVMVFDLQDVGCRYYTYMTTMTKVMQSCAEYGRKFVLLDRPNPNGMIVDGPILDTANFRSGVGYLPVCTVHGMTLGELARMINGESWLPDGLKCDLTVVKCCNYTHQSRYSLPVKPSPNLPDMRSIYLYTSTCYFEGTPVSLGRGTDKPFQVYGHPLLAGYDFSFTPQSVPGAKNPPELGNLCYGADLSCEPLVDEIISAGINLEYVIDAYRHYTGDRSAFFTRFFDLLAGQRYIRDMIVAGVEAEVPTADLAAQIKQRWAPDVEAFKVQRAPYMLYD